MKYIDPETRKFLIKMASKIVASYAENGRTPEEQLRIVYAELVSLWCSTGEKSSPNEKPN